MVPETGIEPVRSFDREILSLLCLPISPPGRRDGGAGRNRTGVHGVAVRCMTTLPPRLIELALHYFGAGNEVRTRDPNLGKVVLYH